MRFEIVRRQSQSHQSRVPVTYRIYQENENKADVTCLRGQVGSPEEGKEILLRDEYDQTRTTLLRKVPILRKNCSLSLLRTVCASGRK